MSVITPGEPSAAPYRRLWALKNISGLVYEAPDPSCIETTFGELVGSDAIKLGQIQNIISQFNRIKLAKFERGGAGSYGYDGFQETVTIKNLDHAMLAKLINEAQQHIDEGLIDDSKVSRSESKVSASKNKAASTSKKFSATHPIIRDIYVAVAAALIVFLILAIA
jgi:hypothetical protein